MLPSRLKFFNDRFLRRPKRFMVAISCLMLLASASRLACANPQTSSISSDISVVLSSQSASSSNCFCEAPQSLYEYSQDGLEDVDDDDHVDDIWDDPLGEIGYLLSTLSPFSDPALDAKAHEVPDEPRSKKRSHQTKARPRYPRRDPQSGPRVIVLVLIPVFIWLFYNYYKSRKVNESRRALLRGLKLHV
ncbi:hypothetical protein DFJ73DRAFT_829301 [Zopfochytrium polystomum]|nr:hypothetical protein DFJ73DRAFT_829301 [Zopfochytrium polystomum]